MCPPVVLWLPKPPDNANARSPGAVRARAREKRAFWEQLDIRRAARLIPPPPAAPIPFAEISHVWHYPDGRWHLDPDNAVRRLKPACDWLVANGYLTGDRYEHVRWLPAVHVVGQATPPLCTVRLTLTPVLPSVPAAA